MVPSTVQGETGLHHLSHIVALDWITSNTTADKVLSDDLPLLSTHQSNMEMKTDQLNVPNSLDFMSTRPTAPIHVTGAPLELVEDFTYLGSLISKDRRPKLKIPSPTSVPPGGLNPNPNPASNKDAAVQQP